MTGLLAKKERRPHGAVGLIAAWLLAAGCLLVQAQSAPVLRLYPVDETARDPQFRSFVKRLRSAVEARRTKALRKLVDEEVVAGRAADDTGWAKFARRWRPDDAHSELWPALSDLLALGFVRQHPSLFVSPYLVWRFPRDLSMATHLVVLRDNAAAWGQWVRVRTVAGQTGYLNARDVMSPLMPRAQFGLSRGRWVLVALEGQEP
ncbi:MAG: hypothetical protein NTY38_09270 [Acidobacteria bacterium]|nr:hypothetical protein [Acidobacteriota bacterium]